MGLIEYYLLFGVLFIFGLPLARRLLLLSRERSAYASRRKRRDDPSGYLGHKDYPEHLGTPETRFRDWALARVDLVVAVPGALTIVRWLGVPGPDDWGRAGLAGVVVMFLSAIALLVATGVVGYLTCKLRQRIGALIAYGCVIALFVVGFLIPVNQQRAADAEASENRAAVIKEYEIRMDRARAKWAADVRAAGAWGAPGTEPPMLKVVDDGASVTVTNVIDIEIPCIQLARIYRDSRPGGGYVRCEMRRGREKASCRALAPGGSQTYELRPIAGDECRQGELEYRVGDYTNPEPSWWTSTALDRFEYTSERIERQ